MRKQSCLGTKKLFFFPEEILTEILSWLEVKYLLRCKSVCKVWYAVIRSRQFVDMHALRNGHRFYNITPSGESLNSDGIKEKFWCVCTSCGFLLEKRLSFAPGNTSSIYRISNPSTKCILDLPHPHMGAIAMRVFLNSSTSSYNVLCTYVNENRINFELLDLGGQSNDPRPNPDLSWKTLNFSDFDNVSRRQIHHFLYCMSSEGVMYILTIHPFVSSNPKIICMDLVKQACTTLNAPQSLSFKWLQVKFQIWRGKPSLVIVLEEKLHVYVLEDYEKPKWSDTIVIPLPFLKKNPALKKFIPFIYQADEEDYLVYLKGSLSWRAYKLESKVWCHVPTPPKRVLATLFSLKGMQPEKKAR